MSLRHAREGLKRLWSRRWIRRITYVLASGSACTVGLLWTVRQPFFNHWLIARLGTLVREETGLSLEARHVEFHPIQGKFVLEGFALGGDLFQGDRLVVQIDLSRLSTFLGGDYHFQDIELENPRILVDADRLARIHLKPHPKSDRKPQLSLDRLTVLGGQMWFNGDHWGLPNAEASFRVYGQGAGPGKLQTDVRIPRLLLKLGTATLSGNMSMSGDLDLEGAEQAIKRGEFRLGDSSAQFHGTYDPETARTAASLRAAINLKEAVSFAAPSNAHPLQGRADLRVEIAGTLPDPSWNLVVQGQEIACPDLGLQPASLQLNAHGNDRKATLKDLHWSSGQGEIQADGEWKHGSGTRLNLVANNVSMAQAATWLRVPFLRNATTDAKGEVFLPGDPWKPLKPDSIELTLGGQFQRDESNAGSYSIKVAKGDVSIDDLTFEFPEISFSGSGKARIGPKGPTHVSAEGTADTDASQVATILRGWKIVEPNDLDMSGQVQAKAQLTWNPREGMQLTGHADIESPRWEGAHGDRLQADVSIQDEDLRIDNILLEKGSGTGTGELWLTWRDLKPGEEAMDMCYRAFRLPIEEGMKASRLSPSKIKTLDIRGLGSGWVRIHGPYDRLRIEASALVESATVVGLKIPAASGDMDLDLKGDHLRLQNVRVAGTPEQLGPVDETPAGDLALLGNLDMDLKRKTWEGGLKGRVDSLPLGIPGPRFQTQAAVRFSGPRTTTVGPMDLPGATISFDGGRLFFNPMSSDGGQERIQSIEGLHGVVESGPGGIRVQMGLGDHSEPLLALKMWPQGKALVGGMDVHIDPQSADTVHLASSLTQDLLKDGLLDLQLEGRLDDSGLHWRGWTKNLYGRFDGFDLLQEQAGILEGDASATSLDMRLQARQTLRADSAATPSSGAVKISGSLPFSPQQPMSLRFEGQAQLANIKSILDHVLQIDPYGLLGYMHPEGTARFDVTAGGLYTAPTLNGSLSLTEGRLQTSFQNVKNLNFNILFQGRDIILPESNPLQGKLTKGTLEASGRATWDLGGFTQYDFHAKAKDFELLDQPEGFELRGSLDAHLSGDDEGGLLKGTLVANRMLYQAEINLRDLILSNAMGGSGILSLASPDDPLTNISLDLDVQMREWEIDTNLLKVRGRPSGPFKIKGNLLEPGILGVMEIVPGGRVTNLLPAGDIVLEEGSITFPDPSVFSPRLDLKGRVDVPPYVVNLHITGSLDSLNADITSTPSLRQDEIIAILIDPSQASTIGSSAGPVSQTALNSGLAATAGGWLQTLAFAEFQDNLRRFFKLDRVNVVWRAGTAGNSEAEIILGKSWDLFGLLPMPVPIVYTHRRVGDVTTQSGQMEWRFGNNFVLQLGVSQSGADTAAPSGEVRHTWVPRW